MAHPLSSDQPAAGNASAQTDDASPGAAHDTNSPPLAPSDKSSSWWTAPGGKPINIPDFTHELRALAAMLFPAPRLVPLRVRARARRR